MTLSVSAQNGEDESTLVEVLVVELSRGVHKQLEKKTPRTRKAFEGFGTPATLLPSFQELAVAVETWIDTGGEARLEDYFTAAEAPNEEPNGVNPDQTDAQAAILAQLQEIQAAMDRRFAHLEGRVDQLRQGSQQARGSQDRPPAPTKPEHGNAPQPALSRAQELLEGVQAQVGRPPARTRDEPGRTPETALEAVLQTKVDANAEIVMPSTDDLVKVALLKLLKDKPGKKAKKLPGLPSWEDDSSSDGQEHGATWSSSSKGGRGIEAVERLNQAMRGHPDAYVARMEQRMVKAIDGAELGPTTPVKFARSCPVGKSRTAGYCLQGFAQVHKLLIEEKPRQARLAVLRMLASLEQFLIDESWAVAGRLMDMEEPPWGEWAVQDPALRRQYVYTRLVESTWIGALINELKEEEWLAKKRSPNPKAKAKGSGKDHEQEPAA